MDHTWTPDTLTLQRYVDRLRALSSDEWQRFAESLTPLRGDPIERLWRRAGHRALMVTPFLPGARGIVQLLAAASEIVGEFHPERTPDWDRVRRANVKDPAVRRHLELLADVGETVYTTLPGDRLAAETATVAANAVAFRARMHADDFAAAYGPMEAFVSSASLDAASPAAAADPVSGVDDIDPVTPLS